jgi:hypothetical protein
VLDARTIPNTHEILICYEHNCEKTFRKDRPHYRGQQRHRPCDGAAHQLTGPREFRSSGVQEFRSSGVQEFKEFKEFITPGDSETVLKEGAYVFITGRRDPELAAGRKRFR